MLRGVICLSEKIGLRVRNEIIKPLRTLSEMSEDKEWRARVDDFITDCLEFAA